MKHIIQCPLLKDYPHGFTTRVAPDNSTDFFNLKGSEGQALKNKKVLESYYPGYKIKLVKQTHSSYVHWVEENSGTPLEADAQITAQSNILLGSLVADCAPVLIAFPKHKCVASIHAGWRGALNGIVYETIMAFYLRYRTSVSDAIVAIGPHISSKHLEFQDPEIKLWEEYFPNAIERRDGKTFVDISKKIIHDCEKFGIEQIWNSQECTFELSDKYFSHRKEKEKAGRQMGFIGLPKED